MRDIHASLYFPALNDVFVPFFHFYQLFMYYIDKISGRGFLRNLSDLNFKWLVSLLKRQRKSIFIWKIE